MGKNKNTWLNSLDITRVMKQLRINKRSDFWVLHRWIFPQLNKYVYLS